MSDKTHDEVASAGFAELSAGHALHALSETDEQRYQRLLYENPEWAVIADTDVAAAAHLAATAAPVPAPPSVREQLLARIAQTEQTQNEPEPVVSVRPARQQLTRRLLALAACLAVLVGLGYGAVSAAQYLNRPAAVVALEEVQAAADSQSATADAASGASATAYWSASLQTVVLVADELEPLTPQQSYELWFVRDGAPISAGVFEASEGTTTAVLSGSMHEGDVIAVTVEAAGGSPDGNPTSDPVIVIPTA